MQGEDCPNLVRATIGASHGVRIQCFRTRAGFVTLRWVLAYTAPGNCCSVVQAEDSPNIVGSSVCAGCTARIQGLCFRRFCCGGMCVVSFLLVSAPQSRADTTILVCFLSSIQAVAASCPTLGIHGDHCCNSVFHKCCTVLMLVMV